MVFYPSKSVQEPWFTLISLGLKSVEGRVNKGEWSKMEAGDQIEFVNKDRSIVATVVSTKVYPSFYRYIKEEGLQKCLPSVKSIREGVNIYHSFPNFKENAKEHGVIAIRVQVK